MAKKSLVQKKYIIYASPFFIFSIGCIVDLVIIPNCFSRKISFLIWLFSNSQNIENLLYYPGITALPDIYSIVGMRIFWWIWLVSFLVSLYLVCRKIHWRTEAIAPNAVLRNKDPYYKLLDIRQKLIRVQQKGETTELKSIIISLKYLEERLKNETNFGYGKEEVITCENHIAEQLQHLSNLVSTIKSGELQENVQILNDIITDIKFSLQKRTDLKRR